MQSCGGGVRRTFTELIQHGVQRKTHNVLLYYYTVRDVLLYRFC